MALDGTYAGLQASVAAFLARGDLAAAIPDFIALAEAQMARKLRCRAMVGQATASISGEFEALPGDFAAPLTMQLDSGQPLDCMTPDALAQKLFFRGETAGTPLAYAVVGSQFQFAPAPDGTYTATLTYFQRPPTLSVANPTSWLLVNHPDAYLYGALTQSALYLQDDDRISVWGELFTTAIDAINGASESLGARLTPGYAFRP
jgi:hypothetical protein